MAHVVASKDTGIQSDATSAFCQSILEHITNGRVSSFDCALLFFDRTGCGAPLLTAESYRPTFRQFRDGLASLEYDRMIEALGMAGGNGGPHSLTADELNHWLPEDSQLKDSCNIHVFPIGCRTSRSGAALTIKDGPVYEEERARVEDLLSVCSEALMAKLEFARMQRKSEEAESLISVINAINSTMDAERMFELIIKNAVELMSGVDGAAIVTFDPNGRSMNLRAGYGYYKRLIEEKTTDFDVPERVLESGTPFLISPEKEASNPGISHSGIRSAICVPISKNDEKIGAILLESSKKEDCFSEENIPLLQAFADGVGLAISKAQSHHLLKEKYTKLEEHTQTMSVAYPALLQSQKLATVGELAGSIAHEINNPLMTIMARTDILLAKVDNQDPIYNSIDVIDKQVSRISSLVQRILEFARISKSEFKPQDINQIVNESILLTENHLRNSNIRHKKCLEDNLPPVLADKNKLQQVFLNLITNAAQAIVGEGTLTITTKMGMDRLGNDRVLVSFKDTGCGIEVENLGKIFDSFFTTKETGTGLGLAISKRIVDEHGGSISVESVVDRGTTVTVALPPIEDPARPGEWPKS